MLAHDLLSYFWAEQLGAQAFAPASEKGKAVVVLEAAAAALNQDASADKVAAFRLAQGQLGRILRQESCAAETTARCLISDLVTLGSPLAHAGFLLADGLDDLEARCRARELPTCPPFRDELDLSLISAAKVSGLLPAGETRLVSYQLRETPETWALHFAAPFAAVRWTNVYDPAHGVAQGDMIGGQVAGKLGTAILDVDISKSDRLSRRFTHTRYWAPDQPASRLQTLREAINLLDRWSRSVCHMNQGHRPTSRIGFPRSASGIVDFTNWLCENPSAFGHGERTQPLAVT
ncbi:hypothetical protein [Mesorhizobium sp. 43Arga]